MSSYLSRQRGRGKKGYLEYAFEKDYMSLRNYIKTGSFINLDYVYSTLANDDAEYPFDYDSLVESKSEFVVVATDAKEAKPVYFTKKDLIKNDYGILKASSCIPIACKAYNWRGTEYFDGAITDPIPIERALQDGCTKIVIVLTRPVDYRKVDKKRSFFRKLEKKYPKLVDKLCHRCELYNTDLDKIKKDYLPNGNILLIGPDDVCGVGTLKFNKKSLERLYEKGYNDGNKIKEFLRQK